MTTPTRKRPARMEEPTEPDWEAILPDDEETYPEPDDFWIEPDESDEW